MDLTKWSISLSMCNTRNIDPKKKDREQTDLLIEISQVNLRGKELIFHLGAPFEDRNKSKLKLAV